MDSMAEIIDFPPLNTGSPIETNDELFDLAESGFGWALFN